MEVLVQALDTGADPLLNPEWSACLPNHAALSPLYEAFIREAVRANRGSADDASLAQNMSETARRYQMGIQAWPAIIERSLHDEIGDAARRLVALAYSIPARVFNNDFEQLRAFFGPGDGTDVPDAFVAPDGFDTAISRCDFTLTADGMKLLEFNLSSNLGGWQIYLLEDTYRKEPALAEFVAKRGVELACRNPLRLMLEHFGKAGRKFVGSAEQDVNVGIAVRPEQAEVAGPMVKLMNDFLAGKSSRTKIFCFAPTAVIEQRGGTLFIDGQPAHVILAFNRFNEVPESVYRAFKNGAAMLVNGPASYTLCSKRTVALLSELADRGELNADECALVRRYIPWTRHVTPSLAFHEDHGDALDILLRNKDRLVLKPHSGGHGTNVTVGFNASKEAWEQASRRAVEGGFVVQEYCASLKYLAQQQGATCVNNFVWGMFVCGGNFAGSWLRTMRSDHPDGVINSARGAVEGIVFEH